MRNYRSGQNRPEKHDATPMPGSQTAPAQLRQAHSQRAAFRAEVDAAQAAAASNRHGLRLDRPFFGGGLETVNEGEDQAYQATTPEARARKRSDSEDGDFDPVVAAPSKPGSGARSRSASLSSGSSSTLLGASPRRNGSEGSNDPQAQAVRKPPRPLPGVKVGCNCVIS